MLTSKELFQASVVNHLFDINPDAIDCLELESIESFNKVAQSFGDQMDKYWELYKDEKLTLPEALDRYIKSFNCYDNANNRMR